MREVGLKIALKVAYDGTDYRGLARQPGQVTVQGQLEERLAHLLRQPIVTTAAGRTDAGVHAEAQVFSFDAPAGTEPGWLLDRLNAWNEAAIVVRDAAIVPDGFDARFSAIRRRYRYQLHRSATADPFLDRYSWWIRDDLKVTRMRAATKDLIGEHDFSSFCRKGQGPPSRRLRKVTLTTQTVPDGKRPGPDGKMLGPSGKRLEVRVEADSFCHQMVRSIVGWMVACGKGDRDPSEAARVLAARDRHAAAPIAPAHGLFLTEVVYPTDPFAR